jgi:hypothetical protein
MRELYLGERPNAYAPWRMTYGCELLDIDDRTDYMLPTSSIKPSRYSLVTPEWTDREQKDYEKRLRNRIAEEKRKKLAHDAHRLKARLSYIEWPMRTEPAPMLMEAGP